MPDRLGLPSRARGTGDGAGVFAAAAASDRAAATSKGMYMIFFIVVFSVRLLRCIGGRRSREEISSIRQRDASGIEIVRAILGAIALNDDFGPRREIGLAKTSPIKGIRRSEL